MPPTVPPPVDADGGPDVLNLKQVAQRLGVHYMTAYRYVRQGRLPARREGTAWVVDRADVERFELVRPSLHQIFLQKVGATGVEEGMSGHG